MFFSPLILCLGILIIINSKDYIVIWEYNLKQDNLGAYEEYGGGLKGNMIFLIFINQI